MTRLALPFICTLLLTASLAHGATIRVNTAGDLFGGDPICSLREAIIATNQNADFQGCVATDLPYGADRIVFSPGLAGQAHVLTRSGAGEAGAVTGDLDIGDDLHILGDPAGTLIDGNQLDRVFDIVAPGISVTFDRLQVSGGQPPPSDFLEARGGGIRMETASTLIMNDSVVTLNGISGGTETLLGGGINSTGTLILNRSEVIQNTLSGTSPLIGAGISSVAGDLQVHDSRISDNLASHTAGAFARGGGIAAENGGSLVVARSEIAFNQVFSASGNAQGGGLRASGATDVTITSSTLSGNEVRSDAGAGSVATAAGMFVVTSGGTRLVINAATVYQNVVIAENGASSFFAGVSASADDIQLANTLIAGNLNNSTPSDCNFGPGFVSQGYNLVGQNCGLSAAVGDQFGIDPVLGPLADNGGANELTANPWTHAPLGGSPVIDAGNPASPGAFPSCPPIDQRGFVRVGIGGPVRCDTGAHERNSPGLLVFFEDGFEGS